MKNVLEVDQKGLCLECGTCVGVCPHSNIMLIPDIEGRNRIHIEEEKLCENCSGICLNVCPGHEIDMDQLNMQVFGKIPSNYWAGNYRQAFLGYCYDDEVQKKAASGGIISTLLIYALQTNIIEGVFLLTPKKGDPFRLEPVLAYDKDTVLNAAGSYYWPAPIGQCLDNILHSDKKFAFIGLPCEIQALRKAQNFSKKLRENVVFTIGLFCGGRPTIQGQKFAFQRYGIDTDQLERINYRYSEWPGYLKVTLKNGKEIHVQKSEQLQGYSGQIFCHPRCIFCHESTAELADISTGDAIRLEDTRGPKEKSLLVARTQTGLDLLDKAVEAKKLNLREVEIEKMIHSQQRPIIHKKNSLWARIYLANKILKNHAPSITMTVPDDVKLTFSDYFSGIKILLVSKIITYPFFRKLMMFIPMSWLKRYSNFSRYS